MTEATSSRRTSARPTRTDVEGAQPAAPLMPKPSSARPSPPVAEDILAEETPEAMIERLSREIAEKNAMIEAAQAEKQKAEQRAREAETVATEAKIRIQEMASQSVPAFETPPPPPSPSDASVLSSANFFQPAGSALFLSASQPSPSAIRAPRKVIEAEDWGVCDTLVADRKCLGSPPYAVEWSVPQEQRHRATAVTLRFVAGKSRMPREIAVALAAQPRYVIQN